MTRRCSTCATPRGELLTIRQAAELIGVHPATVRRMVARGEIKAIKVPGKHRITRIPRASLNEAFTPASAGGAK